MFRKLTHLGLACALFGLVWAASHDILKGEPNAWMEWTVVLAGGTLAACLIRKPVSMAVKSWSAIVHTYTCGSNSASGNPR